MCEWDLMVWKVKKFDVGKRPEIICAKGWILLWKRTRYLMQTDVTKTSVLGRLRWHLLKHLKHLFHQAFATLDFSCHFNSFFSTSTSGYLHGVFMWLHWVPLSTSSVTMNTRLQCAIRYLSFALSKRDLMVFGFSLRWSAQLHAITAIPLIKTRAHGAITTAILLSEQIGCVGFNEVFTMTLNLTQTY